MERVAFILEQTNQRIGCMLNPESFQVHRTAGVRNSQTLGTALRATSQEDDPLLWTGGGRTEITLDLLFDLSLLANDRKTEDVRELTQPLHALSESRADGKDAPVVRFVWGKAWNIRCMVVNVAERFEQFTSSGYPRRSWLSMRLVRVAASSGQKQSPPPPKIPIRLRDTGGGANVPVHDVRGSGGGTAGATGGRLDVLAKATYGNPGYWRLIASFNDIADPMHIPAGFQLRLPPKHTVEERS